MKVTNLQRITLLYIPPYDTATCDVCPEGQTCPSQGMNASLPCPAGYYCESGTDNDGTPCPLGKCWAHVCLLHHYKSFLVHFFSENTLLLGQLSKE